MKKRYIFLIVSLSVIGSLTYYFDSQKKDNEFIIETERELDSLNKERDSIFYFADEVLDHIDEKKKKDSLKLTSLDDMVKNKQITIEQQVAELKDLVKKSQEMQELAEVEKNKAIQFERMAQKQKVESEKLREETLMVLDSIRTSNKVLITENKKQLNEIEKLKLEISKLEDTIEKIKSKYTIELEDDSNDDSKRKKKKKG